MKSIKVKQEVLGLVSQIKIKKNELVILNKQVGKKHDKFYLHQIEDMESGKEATNVINEIVELVNGNNGFCKQTEKMQSLMNTLITSLSSKTINTHISITDKKYIYSIGSAVVYKSGLGIKTSSRENTRRICGLYYILDMLHSYGNEIAEYIPTTQKREVIEIFTKYAKMDKFKPYPDVQKELHKIKNGYAFDYIDTDINSNYTIEKKKVREIGFSSSNDYGFRISVYVSTGIYSSDEIVLFRCVSPYKMYLIASVWDKIGERMMKIRDELVKLYAEREECLNDLTNELSPYLLASKL